MRYVYSLMYVMTRPSGERALIGGFVGRDEWVVLRLPPGSEMSRVRAFSGDISTDAALSLLGWYRDLLTLLRQDDLDPKDRAVAWRLKEAQSFDEDYLARFSARMNNLVTVTPPTPMAVDSFDDAKELMINQFGLVEMR